MNYPIGKLNIEKIQDGIYDWIREETKGVLEDDARIIWRNQSQALPPRPCVTMKIIDGPRGVGRQGNMHAAANKKFVMGMQMEMTVSIQVYGNTKTHRPMAMQLAVDLHSSLMKPEILIALNESGSAVQDVGAPTNITALEETEYEERAEFKVQFGVAQNVKSDPGTIETVNLSGIVDESITGL